MQIFKQIFRNIVALPIYLWQIAFLLFPLILLGYREWSKSEVILSTVIWLLKNKFLTIIFNSFFTAFLVSCLCLTIGYLFSYIITQYSYINQIILLFFASIPFLSNFLIHAASWSCFLENNGVLHKFLVHLGFTIDVSYFLYNKIATIIVLVYCYLPYAILPLYISLSKFDRRLLRASRDLGARPMQTFFKIVVPSTLSAIITSFFLIFIPSTSEFIIPQLIGGDKHLYCGSIFSYVTLTPALFASAPTITVVYIISLLIACWLLLIGIKKFINYISL